MIVWFYLLWSIALIRVLVAPLTFLVRKASWVIVIGCGIWLILGALTYQAQYQLYLSNRQEYEATYTKHLSNQKKLEELRRAHPTARDVLVRLAYGAAALGDREKLLEYVTTLRRVDPNHPDVQTLLHSLR